MMTIGEQKVFISSNFTTVPFSCPPPRGPFSFKRAPEAVFPIKQKTASAKPANAVSVPHFCPIGNLLFGLNRICSILGVRNGCVHLLLLCVSVLEEVGRYLREQCVGQNVLRLLLVLLHLALQSL